MADPYLGEVRMFAGNFAINGWQMCNGQLLSISQYAALFSILGTSYGGNGTTTFGLPDFQGRVPIHQGTGAGLPTYVVGESGGTTNTSLLASNLPSHVHPVTPAVSTATATSGSPAGTFPAVQSATTSVTPNTTHVAVTPLGYAAASTAGAVGGAYNTLPNTGGGLPLSIMQPYLTVTFLIAMVGIFPSRN